MVKVKLSFSDFWEKYVLAHQNVHNRRLHFVATSIGIVCTVAFLWTLNLKIIVIGLMVSYGLAWIGHLLFENNKPLTWTNPLHSFLADLKMYSYILLGKMNKEISQIKMKFEKEKASSGMDELLVEA